MHLESHDIKITAGDVINGWLIKRQIITPPHTVRKWRAEGPCGHDAVLREDVIIMDALPDCPHCSQR